MKRSLISLGIAVLASVSLASVAQPGGTDEEMLDRTLPTYPELGYDPVSIHLADGKYTIDAGESTHEAVVRDVG